MAQTRPSPTLSRRFTRLGRFSRTIRGRHTDQHLVDHAPVQRVRIRACPGRWQRNLLVGAPRTGPTNRHLPPAQHDLTRRMPRSIRLARRLMRIPWPTDGGPILFQHGFEYLQARHDDQLLELGLRINEDIDQRQVPWRRGYRLATARDCARLLLHGGSLLGGLHLGFVTGRIARPVKSRRFKCQQLLGHPRAAGRCHCRAKCRARATRSRDLLLMRAGAIVGWVWSAIPPLERRAMVRQRLPNVARRAPTANARADTS